MNQTKERCCFATVAVGFAAFLALQQQGQAVRIDADDIGGVVTGPNGPEAGVGVIAETTDLPTRFVKIVVTDDQGRYVIPDLPGANYHVWVRGYGLVDSPKTKTSPAKEVNLTAVVATDAKAAAQYYPAGYWFSLLRPPAKSEFPGTGPTGNGISPGMKTQAQFLWQIKSGNCMSCHALGTIGTRELPEALRNQDSREKAWARRLMSGQAGGNMISTLVQIGRERVLKMFADWTDRIAAGEVPPTPPR